LSGTSRESLVRGGPFKVRPGSCFLRAAALGTAVLVLLAAPALRGQADPAWGALADSAEFLHEGAAARAHVGVLAVSLESGDTLLAHQPDRRFIPASNHKLFVTGAFLEEFGPNARGTTRLDARGKVERKHGGRETKLKGDLVLRGSGCPDVVQLLRPGSRGLLDSLAYLLHDAGLVRFEGTVTVDGTLFAAEPYGVGWAIDDLPWSYGAAVNAVLANGNAATLVASSGPKGVSLALEPPEVPLAIEGRVAAADSGVAPVLSIARDPGSHVLRVSGRLPRGLTLRKQVAVPDPDSAAGLMLVGAMKRAGIEVRAKVAVARMPLGDDPLPDLRRPEGGSGSPRADFGSVGSKSFVPILRLATPPASEFVSMVDAYSLNVESEALLRLLDPAPLGKTVASALHRLNAILSDAGVDTLEVSAVDGSGLSPLNLASPRAFVQWLVHLAQSPVGKVFQAALGSPGNVGTLERRFQGLSPSADVRAKTGTLTNVSALSGYASTADGDRVAFSILSNGNRASVAPARSWEEAIVGLIARYRKGAAEEPPVPRMIPR